MAYDPVIETRKRQEHVSGRANKTTGYKLNGVSVEGFDELADQLLAFGQDTIFRLGPATVECAELIAAKARTKAPKLTGELTNGIVVKKPGRQKSHKAYRVFASVQLSKDARHGVPVELGHRLYMFGRKTLQDVEARPFLRPAADESKDQVAKIMMDAMNDLIGEYGGK